MTIGTTFLTSWFWGQFCSSDHLCFPDSFVYELALNESHLYFHWVQNTCSPENTFKRVPLLKIVVVTLLSCIYTLVQEFCIFKIHNWVYFQDNHQNTNLRAVSLFIWLINCTVGLHHNLGRGLHCSGSLSQGCSRHLFAACDTFSAGFDIFFALEM